MPEHLDINDLLELVEKGYTHVAFKYKRNADEFIRAWNLMGYECDCERSSGPVFDVKGQPHCRNAYYCSAGKKRKETKAEKRDLQRFIEAQDMMRNRPGEFWQKMIRRGILKAIDPEILNLVKDLNRRGFYTSSSCAGHRKSLADKRGHIYFDIRYHDGWTVRRIMAAHGLKGIKRESDWVTPEGWKYATYSFDPIGKPNG